MGLRSWMQAPAIGRGIDVGIGIIADSKIEVPHAFWGRDSKVIALALLSRTLSNFKGAAIMVREDLLVEAQVLTRCCFENLISIAGLHTDSAKFIEALVRYWRPNDSSSCISSYPKPGGSSFS